MKGKLANGVGSQYSHTTSERSVSSILLLLSVGFPVANALDVLQPCGLLYYLNVQTITTSRLPKRSWQSEVELNLIIFRRSNFQH